MRKWPSRKGIGAALILMLVSTGARVVRTQEDATVGAVDPIAHARNVLERLQQDRFDEVAAEFNAQMAAALSVEQLTQVIKTYPDLNHLFISGAGRSTPAEYGRPGKVADTVIDDIAQWIARLSDLDRQR